MTTINDFRLSSKYTPEESGGGSIGFWKDGEKIWIPENDFVALLEDEDTKETLVKALKTGKLKAIDSQAVEQPVEASAEDIPPKPDLTWDETEPEAVFDKNTEKPVNLPKYDISDTREPPQEKPRDPAMEKIRAKQTVSPYSAEGERQRDVKAEKITPQNFDEYEKQNRIKFRNYMRKYDFLKTITPKEAASRKIEESQEGWFEEFAQSNGRRGMKFELIDDYRRDKDPEMKEFMYEWQRFHTNNKEVIYDLTYQKFNAIKQQEKEDIYQYEKQMDAKRGEINEEVRLQREEAKKYTPENKVKDMKSLAEAKRKLRDAIEEGGDMDEEKAQRASIELLQERLGVEKIAEGTEGLKNEDKMREHLRNKGMSPEQVEATLKEYAARKKT